MTKDFLQSLHRYWKKCNDILSLVKFPKKGIFQEKNISEDLNIFYRLTVAYALLYVVIEGYKNLELKDKNIDKILLNNVNLDNLRLLRNYTFHFQKAEVSEKLMRFIELKDSYDWVMNLKSEFDKFFSKTQD